jgi:hypothetical protein
MQPNYKIKSAVKIGAGKKIGQKKSEGEALGFSVSKIFSNIF